MHQILPQKPCLLLTLFRRYGSAQQHSSINSAGYTLIEVLTVMCIITALAAIAVPNFMNYLDKARVIKAIGEIRTIEKDILAFQMDNNRFPDNLGQIGRGGLLDPWGNPYQYLNIAKCTEPSEKGSVKGGKGGKGGGNDGCSGVKFRKDRFLVPINSDFDLYSKGKDGRSIAPLTAAMSRDDIVRANNGGFVGLAWKY